MSQLPTTVEKAYKYESTVGHRTWQGQNHFPTLFFCSSASVSPRLRLKSRYTTTKKCPARHTLVQKREENATTTVQTGDM